MSSELGTKSKAEPHDQALAFIVQGELMGSDVCKVILVGRLARDPELKHTPSGAAVCNFTLATSEEWKDKQGAKQEKTEWNRCVVWNKLAEICGQYLVKGKQVYVEGKLETRQWDDKEGNKKSVTEIKVREMKMLGSKSDSFGQNSPQTSENRTEPAASGGHPALDAPDDIGDLPF